VAQQRSGSSARLAGGVAMPLRRSGGADACGGGAGAQAPPSPLLSPPPPFPLSGARAALAAGGAHLARAADAAARAAARALAAGAQRLPFPHAHAHATACSPPPRHRRRAAAGLPFASLSARLARDDAPARLTRRRQRAAGDNAPGAPPLVFLSAPSAPSAPSSAAPGLHAVSVGSPATATAGDATSADAASAAPGGAPQREERILISEVEIKGVTGELAALAVAALTIKPNFAYTLDEVQEDVNRVFQTGYFSNCQPIAEDTRDGVRVTLDVRPNPELKGVVVNGANVLPARVIQDAFAGQARAQPQPRCAPRKRCTRDARRHLPTNQGFRCIR
jgi:hypothetical protein